MQEAIAIVSDKQVAALVGVDSNQAGLEKNLDRVAYVIKNTRGSLCWTYVCVLLLLGVTVALAALVIFNKFLK
jgi:hypothetical protein